MADARSADGLVERTEANPVSGATFADVNPDGEDPIGSTLRFSAERTDDALHAGEPEAGGFGPAAT